MKRRRSKKVLVFGFGFAAAFAFGVLWCDGWRLARSRISARTAAAQPVFSTDECAALCEEATLAVPGVSPAMSPADLQARLAQLYGPASAATLRTANGRYIVGNNVLFFPTTPLCEQPNLQGDCAKWCARYKQTYSRIPAQ